MGELPPIRPWRAIVRGLRALFRAEDEDRDVSDEVGHWLEEAEADLVAGGASRVAARRAVRSRYGDGTAAREDVRSFGWERVLEAAASDVRYALRGLRRSPGFASVTILTLGLGVGAATAVFSVVKPVLFEPLRYPSAERILAIADRSPEGSPVPTTFGTFVELAERTRTLDALAVSRAWRPTLSGAGDPERLEGRRVSARYLDVLSVSPVLGRGFTADEDQPGAADVVLLSDGLWRSRFGADSAIVGRAIALDGRPFTVVGVMPRGFEDAQAPGARLWATLQYDATLSSFDTREWGHHLDMIGRVSAASSRDAARSDLDRVAADPMAERPRPVWASMEQGFDVRSLWDAATAAPRPVMTALLGAAGLLLLISCINVASLLVARSARRRGELAMRVALGAGRARLTRQLVTEGVVLTVLGGVAGLVLARLGVAAAAAFASAGLPGVDEIAVDGSVFAFALAASTAVCAAVGMLPALWSRRALERGARTGSRHGAGDHRARRALVVAQVALAVVLLVGAGLLQRTLSRLFSVDPGFDAAGVVVLQVQAAGSRFAGDADLHRFFDAALDAVRAVPGVEAAALTSQMPLSGEADAYGVHVEGDAPAPGDERVAFRYAVSPDYLDAMGVALLRGRALDEGDEAGTDGVVLVNESFARRIFGGADAVGRRVRVGRTDLPPRTIVGVVADVKQPSLAAGSSDGVYVPAGQWYFADAARWLVVRSARDPEVLVPDLRRAVWSVDPDQPIVRAHTLDDLVAASEAQRRFARLVLDAFASLALVLAAVGLYGVVAGSVADRAREMGVRAALGAPGGRLLSMVVRQGMSLVGLGALLGLVAAVVGSRALTSMLYGVSPTDAVTYAGVVSLLGVTGAVACLLPGLRAARTDPALTLRTD